MKVSVLIPCYNEKNYIRACVESITGGLLAVDYLWEILVIDGGSTDGTLIELEDLIPQYGGRVKLIYNPHKFQVHGLNLGIKSAQGDIIVRCDAHSRYPANYVPTLVELTERSAEDVGNVGTPHLGVPGADTAMARCISMAMSSKVAVGASHRSVSYDAPIEVDTLLFGAWKKDIFDKVGVFDTRFIRGQDLEHNLRLKSKGYKINLHPGTPFEFYTRPNLKKLSRMVYQYAACKIEIAAITSNTPPIRALVPLSFFTLMAILIFTPVWWVLPVVYSIVIIAYAVRSAFRQRTMDSLLLPIVIPSMHLSHAMGMLAGIVAMIRNDKSAKQWDGTR